MINYPSAERHNELIEKYYVPDMGGNSSNGSDLSLILERLDINQSLSSEDKQHLRDKGLFDLNAFVTKLEQTGIPDFSIMRTKVERDQRKNQRRDLWSKYGIDYIEQEHMHQMLNIVLQVETGARLSEKDVIWLTTKKYFFTGLKRAFHKNEALFFHKCFEQSKDPWKAVNASSDYRKADLASEAVKLLVKIDIDAQKDNHLKSAICTTKGGAKRDLRQFDEALQLAEKAHLFDSNSFHPCTLLGAVNYELENYLLGDEWFAKAVERGANPDIVDHELRSIFKRANKTKQEELKLHLLKIDPVRYGWVSKMNSNKKK